MKPSFWNKAGSLLCGMGLLAALLAGCAADEPVTGAVAETLTVQVESVQGSSVTAVVGTLQPQTDAAPGGTGASQPTANTQADATPPDGSMGTPPDGVGGGETLEFVTGSDTITFTTTDSTTITVESPQGSQTGTIDDIVVDAVLVVSLDAYSNATDIVVKNLSTAAASTTGTP